MIITNFDNLATTRYRKAALEILEAGIERVLPSVIMKAALKYDKIQKILKVCGDTYSTLVGRVFVIGGGKASALMAQNLEDLLGPENITDGFVTSKDNCPTSGKIKVIQAGHPIPDQRGVDGVDRMLILKEQYSINRSDLVVCLISGGGSALMPYPADGISLEDKQKITQLLLASGAEIEEINSVRKHLSKIKGGRLGQYFSPATIVSLIVSDVIGNDLSTIASGPTVHDLSTFGDAYGVLKKYRLLSNAPETVVNLLLQGSQGLLAETPKVLNNCHNYIIGDNALALEAMELKAGEIGYRAKIITSKQNGDTATAALSMAEQIKENAMSSFNVFLTGGETTLQLPEVCGLGGRNQHFAAVSLEAMKDYRGEWVVASIGTDGSDYLPDVAGAIVDNSSLEKLKQNKIDIPAYLVSCDSNSLLKKLGNSLIETGGTGTNVGDLAIYLLNLGP